MHQLLPLKWKLWLVIGLAAVISSTASMIGFHPLALGAVVGAVEYVLLWLTSRSWSYLRRIPFLPLWMRVDLSGEWEGVIHSQWLKSAEARRIKPIPCKLNLTQRWDEIVFRLFTDKMNSRSSGALPHFDPLTNELRIQYFFETTPCAACANASPPQKFGSAEACIDLKNPSKITIRYTNERGAGGEITLTRVSFGTKRADTPSAQPEFIF